MRFEYLWYVLSTSVGIGFSISFLFLVFKFVLAYVSDVSDLIRFDLIETKLDFLRLDFSTIFPSNQNLLNQIFRK